MLDTSRLTALTVAIDGTVILDGYFDPERAAAIDECFAKRVREADVARTVLVEVQAGIHRATARIPVDVANGLIGDARRALCDFRIEGKDLGEVARES